MTMTVLLEFTIKEGVEGAHEIIREVLTQTAAAGGSTGIEILIDDADASRITIVEYWESVADREAYHAWRQTPEGANRLGTIMAAPPVIRTFTERVAL